MLSILKIPLMGMLSASERTADAAASITRFAAPSPSRSEAAPLVAGNRAYNPDARPLAQSLPAFVGGYQNGQNGIARGFVELRLAAHAYKANATAFRALDDSLGTLIDRTS